jgi:3-isopropylmalate/(R)-2-methylmalate dehydratase small subunit
MDTTFEIDTRLKYRLECGLDELSATLQQENRIAAFEEEHLVSSTWRIPTKNKEGQKGPP